MALCRGWRWENQPVEQRIHPLHLNVAIGPFYLCIFTPSTSSSLLQTPLVYFLSCFLLHVILPLNYHEQHRLRPELAACHVCLLPIPPFSGCRHFVLHSVLLIWRLPLYTDVEDKELVFDSIGTRLLLYAKLSSSSILLTTKRHTRADLRLGF